jgi:hypothetical protein
VRALALLLVLARAAHAEPLEANDVDPPPPVPQTKLGFRIGFGRTPLADQPLASAQVAIGVEHAVFGKLRVLGEYEWLWLSDVPDDPGMSSTFVGSGHRAHVGLRRAFAGMRRSIIRFYADVEAGGGLGIYDAPNGSAVMPHGFIGLRGGYQVTKRRAESSRVLETELHVRAIVVEHGVGVGGGLGFYWGD